MRVKRPATPLDIQGRLNSEVAHEVPGIFAEVPGGVQVQLGDAFGGEERRVMFRLLIPAIDQIGPKQVAGVVVRYVAVDELLFMARRIQAREWDALDGKRLHYEAHNRIASRERRSPRRRPDGETE